MGASRAAYFQLSIQPAEQVGALHAAQVRRPVHEVVEVRGPGPLQEVAGHVDGQVPAPADRADPLRALRVPNDLGVAEPLGAVDLLGRDGAVCVGVGDDRAGAGGEVVAVAGPVQEGYSAGSWRRSLAWITYVPLDHLRAVSFFPIHSNSKFLLLL